MTATLTSLVHLGRDAWRATAASDAATPVYRWWYRGELVRTGPAEIEIAARGGEVPHVEVRDTDDPPSQADHPGRLTLQWYAAPGGDARRFDIERWTGTSWTLVARLADDGRGHYTVRTDWLASLAEHRYRVRGFDSIGRAATVAELTARIVRHPTVPRWRAERQGDATVRLEVA